MHHAARYVRGGGFGAMLALASPLAAAPTVFDISVQPGPASLAHFSEQSEAEVVFDRNEVGMIKTNPVIGEHEPSAALALMLQGTGLTFAEARPGQFLVQAKAGLRRFGSATVVAGHGRTLHDSPF